MVGVRAEPYEYSAPEAVALELYLMARARGMRIETPAVRPDKIPLPTGEKIASEPDYTSKYTKDQIPKPKERRFYDASSGEF